MTRINCVPPEILSDKHLGAEYRELPRIFALVKNASLRGERPDDKRNPNLYKLGSGHVRFFYPRLGYLRDRFTAVVQECEKRGRKVTFPSVPDLDIPQEWYGDWTPTQEAININIERLKQRGGNYE
jgi:deoxyribonuclease (pyrimidine dimer)